MPPCGEFIVKNNETSSLTGHQVKLTLSKLPTKHSGSTLNLGGRVQSTRFHDLAFVGQDGKILPHQVIIHADDSNLASPECWVKIPFLPGSGQYRVRVYAGHPTTIRNDGDVCFELWDHFTASMNTQKWISASGSFNGQYFSGGLGGIKKFPIGYSYIIYYKPYWTVGSTSGTECFGWWAAAGDTGSSGYYLSYESATYSNKFINYNGTDTTMISPSVSAISNQFNRLEFIRTPTTAIFNVNGSFSGTLSTGYPTVNLTITGGQGLIDWILIKKYTANEPTITAQ